MEFGGRTVWAQFSFWQRSVRVGAVPQGRPKIAQHWSAGWEVGEPASPGRDDSRRGREVSVAPAGTRFGTAVDPALKCWAIVVRPLGWHWEPGPVQ